jgi:succinate-semialdehyde dehydrogenase/glutarate-semialdehyde dehydrogenase
MFADTPSLRDATLLKDLSYINGAWVGAKSGHTFDVINPATGKVIGTMPEMGAEDTREAIRSAENAFHSFRNTPARERSRLLRTWYQLMIDNAEDLTKIITWEKYGPLRIVVPCS